MATSDEKIKLDFTSHKFNSGNSEVESIVKDINDGQEINLKLCDSNISGKQLEYIAENMSPDNKLVDLDLSYVVLDKTGAKAVAKIKSKTKKLQWLNLHDCELDGELLKVLSAEGTAKTMKSLTLSSNPGISDAIEVVPVFIDNFGCKKIDISANSLSSSHFAILAGTSIHKEVEKIFVGENSMHYWKPVADLARNWQVKKMDESDCRMYREDCQEFANSLQGYQLKKFTAYNADRSEKFEEEAKELLEKTAISVQM